MHVYDSDFEEFVSGKYVFFSRLPETAYIAGKKINKNIYKKTKMKA